MNFARFATALTLLASVGCIRKNANITIKVHAKTAEGEDINSATVSLDRQTLGETNAFGTLSYTFEGEQESIHRIDVVKESDSYYFAPHFETIKLPKAASGQWNIDATMYMVPKPRPTKSNLAQEISPESGAKSVETNDASQTLTTAPVATDLGILRDYPFVDEVSHAKPHSTIDLSTLDPGVESESNTADTVPLFTVHTFLGHEPLANAAVYSCKPGNVPALLCKSNDRGRCVVRGTDHRSESESIWSLIVKHPAIKTQIATGPFERNANVRFTVMAGQSQDFLMAFDDIGPRKPAVNVSTVLSGETMVSTSSACGVVSYVSDKRAGDKIHIRMTHNSIKGGFQEFDHELKATPFQELPLKPAKRQSPSFVVEPLLPGASLTEGDLNRWLDLAQASRLNQETVRSLKTSGIDALRLEEFQNISRSAPRSIEVVERDIPAWYDRPNALAIASYRMRSVLYRTAEALSLSVQIYDAKANLVHAISRPIATPNDISVAQNSVVRTFVEAVHHDLKMDVGGVAGPIGKWIVGSSPETNTGVPKVVDGSNTFMVKGPAGSLDIEMKLSPAAILTVNHEPLRFEDDAVMKIGEEASRLAADALLNLVLSVRKDHPQRRYLNLLAAFLESSIKGADILHLSELAKKQMEHGSLAERLNQNIALVLMADREGLAKEERIKNAVDAVQKIDVLLKDLERPGDTDSTFRQIALYYRGQAKAIAGELKNDQMLTLDAEADLREFMKREDDQKAVQSANEQRLRVAAAKALKSLDASVQ